MRLDADNALRVQMLDPRVLAAKVAQVPLGRDQDAGDTQRQTGRNEQPARIQVT